MSELEAIIRAEIERAGPITFARFMELTLYHPQLGYYVGGEGGREPVGWAGDFFTSGDVSPLWGWAIAKQIHQFWQALGAPANGAAIMGQSNGVAGQLCTGPIYYPNALYQAPTSIAFTQIVRTNLNSPSAANLGALGAIVQASVAANGACQGYWTYTTSGNCIRRVGRKLFDWHCDGCGKVFRGLHLGEHLRVETGLGTTPGQVALAVDCPECGAGEKPFTESFNTALRSEDETHERHPHRAEQARLIRALMRSGAVGLDVLP